jgi:hypothetical protein
MWIYPELISYPHLTYWHLIYSWGHVRIWSIDICSQSICSHYRFTWSVITFLRWTHHVGDLPHEEVHLDDKISINVRKYHCVGNTEQWIFHFGKWWRPWLNMGGKCVYSYLASLNCIWIQNKVWDISVLSSLIGSLISAIKVETKITKWKPRAWNSKIYGHYWNNVWWMWWFKWSYERLIPTCVE